MCIRDRISNNPHFGTILNNIGVKNIDAIRRYVVYKSLKKHDTKILKDYYTSLPLGDYILEDIADNLFRWRHKYYKQLLSKKRKLYKI